MQDLATSCGDKTYWTLVFSDSKLSVTSVENDVEADRDSGLLWTHGGDTNNSVPLIVPH